MSVSLDRHRLEHLARLPFDHRLLHDAHGDVGARAPGFSPTWTGSSVRGVPRNAAFSESDSTRNLPSLTEEIAYITTKNASSSVIRSP